MDVHTQLLKPNGVRRLDGNLDSRKYLRRFRRGENTAFGELIDSLRPKLRGSARAITRNPDEVEDAIQNAALRAYLRLGQLRSDSRFAPWIMRITVNEARQYRRLAFNRLTSPFDTLPAQTEFVDPHQLPLETLIREENRRAIRSAIGRLEPQFRQVLVLHYWKQAEVREISRRLGISETNVKTRLYRARKRVLSILRTNRDFAGINSHTEA
jgi:RNA polymerase sigma factor (sigma-70 family)